jgi:hypothetical protein
MNDANFKPENKLEESLIKAATDAAHRPQFYKDLVASDIFVVEEGALPPTEGKITLQKSQELHIRHIDWNGKPVIPVFSSLARLQAAAQREVTYVALNALEFMKITAGAEWVLNPGSTYGKEFTKSEIASIVDGSIWKPVESYRVSEPQQVMFGQPANYPRELIDALIRFFKQKKTVKRAYLAHFFNPARDEKPHSLIGVEASGDWEEVMAGAGMVVQGVQVPDPPVDFIRVQGAGGVNDYFLRDCKPFYEKKLFGFL